MIKKKIKDYISFEIENPLKTYNKIKKYFKPLSRRIQFCKVYLGSGFPSYYRNYSKVLDVRCYDVMWKDKWNSPGYEYNPCLSIVLFKKWKIFVDWKFIDFNQEDHSCEYWESALTWVYYKKDLQFSVMENTGWIRRGADGEDEKIEYKLLNEPYQSKFDSNNLEVINYVEV